MNDPNRVVLSPAEAMKPRAQAWFETLRNRICAAFEAIEDEATGPLRAHALAAHQP
jgi:coproporphyrinogen III oxidase